MKNELNKLRSYIFLRYQKEVNVFPDSELLMDVEYNYIMSASENDLRTVYWRFLG